MTTPEKDIITPVDRDTYLADRRTQKIAFAALRAGERYRLRALNVGAFAFEAAADEPDFAADWGIRLTKKNPNSDKPRKWFWLPTQPNVRVQNVSMRGGKTEDAGHLSLRPDGRAWTYQEPVSVCAVTGIMTAERVELGYFLPYRDEVDEGLDILMANEARVTVLTERAAVTRTLVTTG